SGEKRGCVQLQPRRLSRSGSGLEPGRIAQAPGRTPQRCTGKVRGGEGFLRYQSSRVQESVGSTGGTATPVRECAAKCRTPGRSRISGECEPGTDARPDGQGDQGRI